jgi:hypothetical protein
MVYSLSPIYRTSLLYLNPIFISLLHPQPNFFLLLKECSCPGNVTFHRSHCMFWLTTLTSSRNSTEDRDTQVLSLLVCDVINKRQVVCFCHGA